MSRRLFRPASLGAILLLVLIMTALPAAAAPGLQSPAHPQGAQTVDPFKTHFAYPMFILHNKHGQLRPDAGSYSAGQLEKAYGVDQLSKQGNGMTIAIDDACGNPTAQTDINKYDNAFGLPKITLVIVKPQGQPCNDQGWGLETDLDIEMAHAMAPQANIVLEEARSSSYSDLFGAAQDAYNNHGATAVSMSFLGGEFPGETGAGGDGIFSTGNAKGVSFTAASGDGGCGVGYPSASPYVTSVGGTSLFLNNDNSYNSENAWGGSGGGLSAYESRPSYQVGFNNNTQRGVPDVAMVSDPNTGVAVYDSGYGGFVNVGGTSVATPLWAGVITDANSSSSSGTFQNVDNQLYSVASNPSQYASDYHDITNGSSGGVCNAQPGYDYVTGLGTGVANNLVPALNAPPGPTIRIDPNQGSACNLVTISGSNFGPSEQVTLTFGGQQFGSAMTDSNGNFSGQFTVPGGAVAGNHTVQATGQISGLSAQFSFVVPGNPNNLTYNCGQVMTGKMKVYAIYWNPDPNVGGFPPGYSALMNQYYTDVGPNRLYKLLKQYTGSNGKAPNSAKLAGTWLDTVNPYPASNQNGGLGVSDILAEVQSAQAANGWVAGPSNYFVVYTDTAGNPNPANLGSPQGSICAWHSYDPGTQNIFAYIPEPTVLRNLGINCDPPKSPNATACGVLTINGNQITQPIDCDNAINISAHEQFEAATDPVFDNNGTWTGWYRGSVMSEIGDLCNANFGKPNQYKNGYNQQWNGHPYIIQLMWNNKTSACALK